MNESYENYLLTDHWKSLKEKAQEKHGAFCSCCGSTNVLHVHHISYTNNWYTATVDDLMPLCKKHHDTIHAEPRLDWILKDRVTSMRIKRNILLHFLKKKRILTVQEAAGRNEETYDMLKNIRKHDAADTITTHQMLNRYKDLRAEKRSKAMKSFGYCGRIL